MFAMHHARRLLLTACFTTLAASACAQAPKSGAFEPQVGQEGKDVVWVPTSQALVDKMLDMAKVTAKDYVIDLGSGDGRTVITAAKRGATATGIEYNPKMVELSRASAAKEGVSARATFNRADLFEADLSKATVITMFLLPDINLKLRPKILNLRPGTRIVSNSFTMAEWKADQTENVTEGCNAYCTAYLWYVPAQVDGTWKTDEGEVTFKQSFQMIGGAIKSGSSQSAMLHGQLRGDQITFSAGGYQYSGRVSGNTIDGTRKAASGSSKWTATRAGG